MSNIINPKRTESPENYQQRLACILVLDTSLSMHGPGIDQLNQGVKWLLYEIAKDPIKSQRVELGIVTFNSNVEIVRYPTQITIDDYNSFTPFKPPARQPCAMGFWPELG